jgi:hypothetical protein
MKITGKPPAGGGRVSRATFAPDQQRVWQPGVRDDMATISIFNAGGSSLSIHTEVPVVDQDGDPDLRSSTPDIASIDEHQYTKTRARSGFVRRTGPSG